MDIEAIRKATEETLSRNKRILSCILAVELLVMLGFIWYAPAFTPAQQQVLFRIPHTPQEFLELIAVLQSYTTNSYSYIMAAFCFLYLALQSFGIPGPLILSIIAGALFGRWVGLVLVVACSTIGATLCYLMSETLGKGIVVRRFPQYIVSVYEKVNEHSHNLFFYMLFLRLTPILPNWFINISSPIIGVPKSTFIGASFLGLIPANVIYINTGMTLSTIQAVGLDLNSVLFLLFLSLLALIPTFIAKKHKIKQ